MEKREGGRDSVSWRLGEARRCITPPALSRTSPAGGDPRVCLSLSPPDLPPQAWHLKAQPPSLPIAQPRKGS